MKAAIIAGCVVLSVLATASGALAAEPNEHWRCGPFDINIIPGDSYVPGEDIVLK